MRKCRVAESDLEEMDRCGGNHVGVAAGKSTSSTFPNTNLFGENEMCEAHDPDRERQERKIE